MKKNYISPVSNNIERRNTADIRHIGMGGTSIGTDTMHADTGFFDEEPEGEDWAQMGNLWDTE